MKKKLSELRISLAIRTCGIAANLMPDGDTKWIVLSSLVELRDFLRYRYWAEANGQRAVSLSSYKSLKSQWKNRPWENPEAAQ